MFGGGDASGAPAVYTACSLPSLSLFTLLNRQAAEGHRVRPSALGW